MRRIALAGLLALGGCAVGPDFERPRADTAPAFAAGDDGGDGRANSRVASRTWGGAVDPRWWRTFGDPTLASLVDRLAAQNLDLAQAAERVTQARAVRRVTRAQGLPQLSADPTFRREGISENGTPSLIEPTPGAPTEYDVFRPQATASWELDLFGRVRRAVEAAGAETAAAIEARRGLALSAIAELAQDYMELRATQAQERVIRANIAASQARSKLLRDRFRLGAASDLEVAQADAQETAISQDLPGVLNQQAALANAIGLLLAEPPRAMRAELAARPGVQPLVPPLVTVGVPGDLVRRRPDIREAEARLHAATARTGVAVASFYPSVTLSGSAGLESLNFGSLFDWASRVFTAGATVRLPIFQGGRLKGTLELREAEQREAAIAFRAAVLRAWHEADDALVAYAQAQRTRADAAATVAADERLLAAARRRFDAGAADFLTVIAAQASLYGAQNATVLANARIEGALVRLYKALGGGWEVAEITPPPAPAPRAAPAP